MDRQPGPTFVLKPEEIAAQFHDNFTIEPTRAHSMLVKVVRCTDCDGCLSRARGPLGWWCDRFEHRKPQCEHHITLEQAQRAGTGPDNG